MTIKEETAIPEVQKTIVKLITLSGDEKIREEAYYREKQLHDEASALGYARKLGRAEGRAEGRTEGKAEERERIICNMRQNGFTEKEIECLTGEDHYTE